MFFTIAILAFFFVFPVFLIGLNKRYPLIDKVGTAVLCYVVGVLLSFCELPAEFTKDLAQLEKETIQETLMGVLIALALPLFLFSLDLRSWFRLAGKTILSMVFGLVAVVITTFVGFLIFKDIVPESYNVAGMLIGVYTGGTVNMVSMKAGLGVNENLLLLTVTADMLVGLPLLIFILSFSQRVFLLILPRFQKLPHLPEAVARETGHEELSSEKWTRDLNDYSGFFTREKLIPLFGALGLAILILAISSAFFLVPQKNLRMAFLMLSITTLGLLSSFFPKVRNIDMTFHLGQYFVLIFCIAAGSLADLPQLWNSGFSIILFVSFAVVGSFLIHVLLSAIFRIDADTTIITATALLFSPPFVPVVASALKNKEIVISGVTVGTVGYALGNYLGISLAFLYKSMM